MNPHDDFIDMPITPETFRGKQHKMGELEKEIARKFGGFYGPQPDVQKDAFLNAIRSVRNFRILIKHGQGQVVVGSILAGLELRHVQQLLRETAPRCTFKEWLASNKTELGFGERTAFKYLKLAEKITSLMADSNRGYTVVKLCDRAPSSLDDRLMGRLMSALSKIIKGRSLTELYELFAIANPKHPELEDRDTPKSEENPNQPQDEKDESDVKGDEQGPEIETPREFNESPLSLLTLPGNDATTERDVIQFEIVPPIKSDSLEAPSARFIAEKALALLKSIPDDDEERREAFQLVRDYCDRSYPGKGL